MEIHCVNVLIAFMMKFVQNRVKRSRSMTALFISTDNASCEDVAGSLDDPKSQGRVKLHMTSARNCVKEKRLQSLSTRLESNSPLNKK